MSFLRFRISFVFHFTFSHHFKKVTCTDEQCLWRTEELGIGVLVTNDIAFDSGVVDLLISKSYDQPLRFKDMKVIIHF